VEATYLQQTEKTDIICQTNVGARKANINEKQMENNATN
jgi:hypothetical protein